MKSKSSTRFSAATTTITMLMPMPTIPLSCRNGIATPNMPSTQLTRYISMMPPVAAVTPSLKFLGRADQPGAVREQQREQRRRRQPDRLDRDAGKDRVEQRRDAAEEEPFAG